MAEKIIDRLKRELTNLKSDLDLTNAIKYALEEKEVRDLIYDKGNFETLYSQDINVKRIAGAICSHFFKPPKEDKEYGLFCARCKARIKPNLEHECRYKIKPNQPSKGGEIKILANILEKSRKVGGEPTKEVPDIRGIFNKIRDVIAQLPDRISKITIEDYKGIRQKLFKTIDTAEQEISALYRKEK